MIKVYRDKRDTNDCMPTLVAFVGYDKKELKKLVLENYKLYDLTEYIESENYILVYFPTIKHYLLDTVENFVKKYPYTKWTHVGNIK